MDVKINKNKQDIQNLLADFKNELSIGIKRHEYPKQEGFIGEKYDDNLKKLHNKVTKKKKCFKN